MEVRFGAAGHGRPSDGSSIAAFHRADMVTIPQRQNASVEGDDPRRVRCSDASDTAPRTHEGDHHKQQGMRSGAVGDLVAVTHGHEQAA